MNEFRKLVWRSDAHDSELDKEFLSEEHYASLYVYKSFDNPIKASKPVKLHVPVQKFVPGLKQHRLIYKRSLLTKSQKVLCLQAMKLFQSGKREDLLTQKEKFCLKIYEKCHSKIVEENALFNDFVRNYWENGKQNCFQTKAGVFNFAWGKWKQKISRYLDYPQFYKECQSVCLHFDENGASVDFEHLVQPLEIGSLARFMYPNLKEECLLKAINLKKITKDVLSNSKLPVSQDENIAKLLENYNFDVAISSSALKQIIDYTNTKSKWIIPIVIQEMDQTVNGTVVKKKIVFVDKVLPKVNPTPQDLVSFGLKQLLKLQFCQFEAFTYPIKDTPLEEVSDEEPSEDTKTIHHNANYRIWTVRNSQSNTMLKTTSKTKDIKLLVRCKLDACEENDQSLLNPVILRTKIEQQVQYGANINSKSELARDWTALFFRLFSSLYRARVHAPNCEIVAVEKCSIQKVNSEAHTHYGYKPILGLGVLQNILNVLVDLDCGTYLLRHLPKDEAFVSILKQDVEGWDLHSECDATGIDNETKPNWLPIDVNYILPVHEEHQTVPALFHGFDDAQKSDGKVVKKNKGKKKKKTKTV